MLSGGQQVFSPSVAGSTPLGAKGKLRGAIGYGFRLPTFTDLYYSDPTTIGNAQLQPESAWSYELGTDWFVTPHLLLSATGFTSPQHNAIDYTRPNSNVKWQATNLGTFQYTGVETSVLWQPSSTASVRAGWTYIHGDSSALGGLQSEYVFHYPVNNGVLEYTGRAYKQLQSRAHLAVVQRVGQVAYPVLDVGFSYPMRKYFEPYLQVTNTTNTGYEEIQGVRVQGRAFIGGLTFELAKRR